MVARKEACRFPDSLPRCSSKLPWCGRSNALRFGPWHALRRGREQRRLAHGGGGQRASFSTRSSGARTLSCFCMRHPAADPREEGCPGGIAEQRQARPLCARDLGRRSRGRRPSSACQTRAGNGPRRGRSAASRGAARGPTSDGQRVGSRPRGHVKLDCPRRSGQVRRSPRVRAHLGLEQTRSGVTKSDGFSRLQQGHAAGERRAPPSAWRAAHAGARSAQSRACRPACAAATWSTRRRKGQRQACSAFARSTPSGPRALTEAFVRERLEQRVLGGGDLGGPGKRLFEPGPEEAFEDRERLAQRRTRPKRGSRLCGSWTNGSPSAVQKASVSSRPTPSSGRTSESAPSLRCLRTPASAPKPPPRERRSSTVSAWSRRVWPVAISEQPRCCCESRQGRIPRAPRRSLEAVHLRVAQERSAVELRTGELAARGSPRRGPRRAPPRPTPRAGRGRRARAPASARAQAARARPQRGRSEGDRIGPA